MSYKVKASLAIAALALSATSALAAGPPVNPWAPAQTTVPITVTVQPMIELYTQVAPVALQVVDAGENQGSANAVQRTITHLNNVAATVSAEIDNDIAFNTQFHILIDPVASWAAPGASGASKTLSWRRDGAGYLPATGAFPNQISSAGAGSANKLTAFSAPINAGGPATVKNIQYFADLRNVMAVTGSNSFNVIWTIAP